MVSNVPGSWKRFRLGQVFVERKEKGSDLEFPALSVTKKGIVHQLETAAKTDDGDNRKIIRVGDYAINSRSDRKGSGGLSEYEGSTSQITTVLIPKGAFGRFVHHLLRSKAFQEEYYRWGHGIVADLWTTRYSDMKNIRIAMPPIETQKEIADFLDTETARIDALIERKNRQAECVRARFKSLQRERVFRLNVEGQKSCSWSEQWIPPLPESWQVRRASQIFDKLDFRRIPLSAEDREHLDGHFPYYGASGVIDYINDYIFDEDTILVGEDGANLVYQSTPVAFKASGQYWVNNHAHILKPRFGVMDFWINALNQIPFEFYVTGSAQPKLTAASLGAIKLPVPSENEQRTIANELNSYEASTSDAVAAIQKTVLLLSEQRSALITAAVTGQIDVKEYKKTGRAERQLDHIHQEAEQ